VNVDIAEGKLASKLWRLQNLYFIKSKTRGLIKLKFNRVQWGIIRKITRQREAEGRIRHYDLKARQQGISTFWLAWWLDDTIFVPNTTTGLLAHTKDSLQYLMEIVRLAHARMPDGVRPRLGDDSKLTLSFPDSNSKFMGALQIRSTALHNLHVSELCFIKDAELRASLGACSEKTNITMESTGNGVGNDGYQIYQDAKAGNTEDGTECTFFPWFVQDEYRKDLNGAAPPRLNPEEERLAALMRKDWGLELTPEQVMWRRGMRRSLKGMFRQEYPETDEDAFLTSGHHFFDIKKIHRLLYDARQAYDEGKYITETDDFIQYEAYDKTCVYAAGADPADGGNSSVLKIFNVTKRSEAFVFRARVSVPTFYQACDKWCRHYGNALLGVERNNHGHAVLLGLEEVCRYPNLYRDDATRHKIVHVGRGMRTPPPEPKLGWLTDATSRPIMLDALKYALEGDDQDDDDHFQSAFLVRDTNLLKECLTFEEVSGKFQAIEGELDDDIFASAIGWQMFLKAARYSSARGSGGYAPGVIAHGKREAVV
jgi:hypothetical protein